MMIESLSIRGFQTHRRVKVKLDSSVTTLVGNNDSGKSAIIRALRFVCLNQHPKDFIHWDGEECTVKLKVDGHIIKRTKGETNTYSLNNKESFRAVNKSVPEEIAQIINLSDVNFQEQHEQHFWFSKTPGQVSRELNDIVNLSVIDNTIANIGSKLNEAKSEAKVIQKRIDEYTKSKEELAWVPEMVVHLSKLTDLKAQIDGKAIGIDGLAFLIKDIKVAVRVKENAAQVTVEGQKLTQIGQKAIESAQRVDVLHSMCIQAILSESHLNEPIPSTRKLDRIVSKIEEVFKNTNTLNSIIDAIESFEEIQCQASKLNIKLEKKLHKLTKGVCPICQRSM